MPYFIPRRVSDKYTINQLQFSSRAKQSDLAFDCELTYVPVPCKLADDEIEMVSWPVIMPDDLAAKI